MESHCCHWCALQNKSRLLYITISKIMVNSINVFLNWNSAAWKARCYLYNRYSSVPYTRNARLFCHVTGDILCANIKWPTQTICGKNYLIKFINFNCLSNVFRRPYCWSNFFDNWVVVYRQPAEITNKRSEHIISSISHKSWFKKITQLEIMIYYKSQDFIIVGISTTTNLSIIIC